MKKKLLISIVLLILVFLTTFTVVKAYNEKESNQVTMQDVNQALTKLPKEYVQQFYQSGWRFVVTDTNKNYYGLTDTNNKIIYIYNKPHTTEITITDTVLHEFGHYYDYSNNWISNSKDFMIIYNNRTYTDSSRNDDYCYRNPQELYATMFKDKFN